MFLRKILCWKRHHQDLNLDAISDGHLSRVLRYQLLHGGRTTKVGFEPTDLFGLTSFRDCLLMAKLAYFAVNATHRIRTCLP